MDKTRRPDPHGRLWAPLHGWRGVPMATVVLLTVNIIVWVVSIGVSDGPGLEAEPDVLLDFGAMFGPLIADGEYWRLFTAMFLHHDITHLGFNGFALFIFGRLVERAYGHTRFVTIYILAGLFGSVASYMLNTIAVGAGASGAIFGVLGALAAYFVAQRKVLGQIGQRELSGVMLLAAISLLYGLATPGIDNWAHFGGFGAGFVLGFALAPRYRVEVDPFGTPSALVDANSLAKSWRIVPAAAAVLLVGAWLGTVTLPDNPYSHIYLAERYLEREQYREALAEADEALLISRTTTPGRFLRGASEARLLRGQVFAELGDPPRALVELRIAIRLGDRRTREKAIALLVSLSSRR